MLVIPIHLHWLSHSKTLLSDQGSYWTGYKKCFYYLSNSGDYGKRLNVTIWWNIPLNVMFSLVVNEKKVIINRGKGLKTSGCVFDLYYI